MSGIRVSDTDAIYVIVCCSFNQHANFAEVEALKKRVKACEHVRSTTELSGAFDFMVEAAVADLPTYNAKRKSYAETLSRLVDRFEASFVCSRYDRNETNDDSLWIPLLSGLRRIHVDSIDKITSEGDYVRIHHGELSSLVSATMASFVEKLDPLQFLQIHRTMIVRCEFINQLIHQPHRWFAELADGTRQRISKSHVAVVLRCIKGDPSTPAAHSAMHEQVAENTGQSAEELMRID
ncbi:LytTR family DNA-binding domain-containing protein [Sphingomonas sp.]|uniref:LytTR family DNA-binding domain-containing protein n=1 Tax=Sphingomonas sp. TaxID=28214 RepID=UPI00286AE832|nr:LytTR family DNA-binding domain-containing protein [Sphingomonas sp.]